jgi:hypothetical protein
MWLVLLLLCDEKHGQTRKIKQQANEYVSVYFLCRPSVSWLDLVLVSRCKYACMHVLPDGTVIWCYDSLDVERRTRRSRHNWCVSALANNTVSRHTACMFSTAALSDHHPQFRAFHPVTVCCHQGVHRVQVAHVLRWCHSEVCHLGAASGCNFRQSAAGSVVRGRALLSPPPPCCCQGWPGRCRTGFKSLSVTRERAVSC